jgi:hypothetical protein
VIAVRLLLALVVLAGGCELLARQLTPAWPGYMLRPVAITEAERAQWQSGMAAATFVTNSWQMRDRERSAVRPAGVSQRVLFVGDSVLDGTFTRAALPLRVEADWAAAGQTGREAVNLGVTNTGPVDYYWRLRRVGLDLEPDAAVLMFFSGNDFLYQSFAGQPAVPPLVDELPRPSLLGAVLPHTTRFGLDALRRPLPPTDPSDQAAIDAALARPRAEGVPRLAELMHRRFFPQLDRPAIEEIVGRGGERFWAQFQPRAVDREILSVAVLRQMIASETEREPTVPAGSPEIAATLSWLEAAFELARRHKLPFAVALAPVATVDPAFTEFWQPWPHYNRYNVLRDGHHDALARALAQKGIPLIDLKRDLAGVRDAFRKTDMHWTEKGCEIVAARLASEALGAR